MIYFITGNKGKLKEARTILGEIEGLDIDLPEIQEVDAHRIIREKLKEARENHDGDFIVEDTSLYLDALNGLPGPLIKWFMETIGNDGLWQIAEKFENHGAQAKTLIGYSNENREIKFFEGTVKGKIVQPSGTQGFGWDPIFLPDGHTKTFAEMNSGEKN